MSKAVLRGLLTLLAWAVERASRKDPLVRSRITRDVVFQITTDDGVARYWQFDAATRTAKSSPRLHPAPDAGLRFDRAATARRCLFSRRAEKALNEALASRAARIVGNGAYALWFGGLLRKRVRRKPLPSPYVAHDPASEAARAITVEPACRELDPTLTEAWRQRAKLRLVRVPAGEPPTEF
jgi:hypothetical protein